MHITHLRFIAALAGVLCLVGCTASGGGSNIDTPDPDTSDTATMPTTDAVVGDTSGSDCTCEGIECGPNACGDICGTCTGGLVCDAGACTEPGNNPNPDPPGETCATSGFTPVQQVAEHNPANGPANFFRYVAIDSDSPPASQLQIQSYLDFGGPKTPGEFDLTGSNFEDCGLCLLLDIVNAEGKSTKTFLADTGSVKINEFGSKTGESFSGTFNGVVFREVTIDPQTYKSTLVPDGATWCMDGYTFAAQINGNGGGGGGSTPQGTDDPLCGGDNIGTMVGSSIANFKLQNCNGEWVNLHTECGSKAVHIFGTAGWCPSCSTALQSMANFLGGQISEASVESKWPGVKMWVVLSENPNGAPPSLDYCKAYAADKKIDPAIMFVDNVPAGVNIPLIEPQGYAVPVTGFGTTYSHINPYLKAEGDSVSLGVPWSAVLKGGEMEYYWSDYYDKSKNWEIALQEVLAAP